MNKQLFPSSHIFPALIALTVLWLSMLACGGASSAPPAGENVPQPTAPLPSIFPTVIAATAQPAMLERRYLKLEFPPKIRVGDSDIIRLTLEVDDKGNIIPTAEVEGNVVTGNVIEIPNLYETHYVIAEARFDIVGIEVRPTELISMPISQGQTAVFFWSVRASDVGTYRGTIWLYLRFTDKVSGAESRKTVSAQVVELDVVNFLGLSVNLARSTGVIGSIIGSIIGFPFFEDIVKFFFKKRGKSKI